MEITIEKRQSCTVLLLNGRFDAEGALLLAPYMDRLASEEENHLVIDMSYVTYLSSGGIRALNKAYKLWKNKNRKVVLAGTGDFSRKVLEISGFDRIFPRFATVEQAIRSFQENPCEGSFSAECEILPGIRDGSIKVSVLPRPEGKAGLVLTGPWKEAQLSGLKVDDLMPLQLRKDNYILGIGTFGPSAGESVRLLGDMVAAGAMVAWAPPGGRSTADYVFTDRTIQSELKDPGLAPEIPGVFSACTIGQEGGTHEIFMVEPSVRADKEFTMGDLYSILLEHARKKGGDYNGILSVKILAQVRRLETLDLEKSPIESNRPGNREQIWTRENYNDWFRQSIADTGGEVTLVGFGALCDRSVKTRLDQEIISNLFPANIWPEGTPALSYTLGITFKSQKWDPDSDIDRVIRRVETEGDMTGVYRLTPATVLVKALVGVSYIDYLRCDDGPVIEFEEPCPEWTGEYEKITRQLHRGSKTVLLSRISGGFSGSLVFRASVTDRSDRKQMPFVMKLGPWPIICDEVRGYTDYVERYILNSSTRLIQHRKVGESGGILYNFVGIGDPSSILISLEDFYRLRSPDQIEAAFDQLFRVVLNTWYGQPARGEIALYREYQRPPLYEESKEYACLNFGASTTDPDISLPCGLGKSANPLYFIEHILPSRLSALRTAYNAPQHGDLNLKNVLLDQEGHMWLIDFSDTRISHNLRDIAKMETVLRTELITYSSDDDVCRMAEMDKQFIAFNDLGDIPGLPERVIPGETEKAFRIIRKLRYYADLVTILDDDPDQYLIALLWYTLPVLWYRSVGEFGKKFAWITASRICERLKNYPTQ
jgi:anti-anti-sigma factor